MRVAMHARWKRVRSVHRRRNHQRRTLSLSSWSIFLLFHLESQHEDRQNNVLCSDERKGCKAEEVESREEKGVDKVSRGEKAQGGEQSQPDLKASMLSKEEK